MRPGGTRPSLLIDSSTINPVTAQNIAKEVASASLHRESHPFPGCSARSPMLVDAPVSGGELICHPLELPIARTILQSRTSCQHAQVNINSSELCRHVRDYWRKSSELDIHGEPEGNVSSGFVLLCI